eukprot:TRINITY_DN642_c1_g1_i1.p1 TRINITY_DN642_c1_g1~~TRINITY_DN642_c1_g1_i1.p1  ORF type:complete len:197 (-),score=116.92 TRINITY_DN642_c1_g1_i1:70-660(-)
MADSDNDDGYRVAAKVDMGTLLQQDAEDESLRKYKQSLGLTALDPACCPANDPRRVVITALKVIFEARPGGNEITFPLDTAERLAQLRNQSFTLKEACKYKIQVQFKVQHEIVSGLKFISSITRKGLRVAKEEEMLGSFAPQIAPHEVTFPRHGWDEAPAGLLSRGNYVATNKFVDDDKMSHLEFQYAFAIKKDWS